MDIDFVRTALDHADLNALRTALYQATGDVEIRDLPMASHRPGQPPTFSERDVQRLKDRAQKFLTEEVDGFLPVPPDPDTLRSLMELTLGRRLSDDEFDLHHASPGFSEFPRDVTWSAGAPPTLPPDFSVAVVGAGMSGISMGVMLKRLGIPFVIYERRHELGGTWSINTYPDARVDTASATYELRFAGPYRWTEYFARQHEVRGYLEDVAARYGVIDHIRFGADVTDAAFDDGSSTWSLLVTDRDGASSRESANVVVSASGLFSTPKPLDVHGADTFEGEILHTTEWTERHSVEGKSVAVIGNGSTGVQLLGRIARDAAQVYQFQRTPQWISPRARYGDLLEPEVQWLLDNMPYYWNWSRFTPLIPAFDTYDLLVPDADWQRNGGHFNAQNDAVRATLTDYIKQQTGGRADLVDRLVPDYPPVARRLVVDNQWYRTLTHEHVELVTDPITHIEPHAIVTTDGTRREVDVILAAIGFSVTKYLWPTQYRGRAGVRLEDVWHIDNGGPRAFAGVSVPGFPNLFILYGPNSQPTSGGLMLPAWIEIWVAHIAQAIVTMLEGDHREIEVRQDAFDAYNTALDERAAGMIWSDTGSIKQNYYVNDAGRLQTGNPWQGVEFFAYLKHPRADDYALS